VVRETEREREARKVGMEDGLIEEFCSPAISSLIALLQFLG
jgi:hypothetical protein